MTTAIQVTWICVVVCRNVQELNLQFCPVSEVFVFPDCLFASKLLTSLNLFLGLDDSCQMTATLPNHISLPVLRTLHLKTLNFSSSVNFLDKLFLGRPALETLILVGSQFKSLNISSLQLKNLEIEMCSATEGFLLVVSAPNLIKFLLCDFMFTDCSLGNLFALEIAKLQMDVTYRSNQSCLIPQIVDGDGYHMIKCLNGLYNINSLTVSAPFLQLMFEVVELPTLYRTLAKRRIDTGEYCDNFHNLEDVKIYYCICDMAISELPTELENWPTPFSKLRYLHVETWLSRGSFRAIAFLLLNSPNIEGLDLDVDPTEVSSSNLAEDGGVECSLKFKLYHLKLVEFHYVTGSAAELQYLNILSEKAVTLKKVSIFTSKVRTRPKRRELDIPKEVLSLPRASSDVTIHLCK
ncbi:hypothetical protein IFM89_011082 [Coptis chinensis]|uniref:F-box/LRR-repeat protein 15/At3g58940/PEG3-like LRR domain-containing protein n=1 Tax=Coptis chinensis TaxID=261450 RepID=A0A835M8I8_9MAGN|nr:hypothetical protein IFM89_011082 [Coptis chinensis]